MKKLLSLFLIFFSILRGVTAQNIYESIGKKADILTLSEGKYQEIFTNDTIVHIGSVLFNRVTNEVVEFVTKKDSNSLAEADVASRFLSVDPIGREYPNLTPYAFAENDVIRSIDLDGLEKVALSGDAPSTEYAGFGTHYYSNQAQTFAAQTIRLHQQYGVNAQRVYTGKEILYHLSQETKNHGPISFFAYFGHSGSNGLFMSNNAGFYTGSREKSSSAHPNMYSNVSELSYLIKKGDIKFTPNACIFLASCNTGSDSDYMGNNDGKSATKPDDLFAGSLVLETGVTVITATGLTQMDNEKSANGKLKTTGEFLKLERIEIEIEVDRPNNKKRWEFWKPDTIKAKEKKYEIKSTSLGNTINVDDYVPK